MKSTEFKVVFPKVLQWILNVSLVGLSIFLVLLMAKEIFIFADITYIFFT